MNLLSLLGAALEPRTAVRVLSSFVVFDDWDRSVVLVSYRPAFLRT